MNKDEEYFKRFASFMDDAEADGVDGINIMMNYLMGFVEAVTQDDPETGLVWNLEDKDLVISVEPAEEQSGRLH